MLISTLDDVSAGTYLTVVQHDYGGKQPGTRAKPPARELCTVRAACTGGASLDVGLLNSCVAKLYEIRQAKVEVKIPVARFHSFVIWIVATRLPAIDYLVADLVTVNANRRTQTDSEVRRIRPELRSHSRYRDTGDPIYRAAPTGMDCADHALNRIVQQYRHAVRGHDADRQLGGTSDQCVDTSQRCLDTIRPGAGMSVIDLEHRRLMDLARQNEAIGRVTDRLRPCLATLTDQFRLIADHETHIAIER
jgi:hypothetical protein